MFVRPILGNWSNYVGKTRFKQINCRQKWSNELQKQITDKIRDAVRDTRVVIYNAPYDSQYLPELEDAAEVRCAMREFADWNKSKWLKLVNATKIVGYEWEGAHRALADTKALRAVWKAIQ